MITAKPYYKTGTGLVEDGKVIPNSGLLLGWCIFEVEPKKDRNDQLTYFVTRLIEGPMSEDRAMELVAERSRHENPNAN